MKKETTGTSGTPEIFLENLKLIKKQLNSIIDTINRTNPSTLEREKHLVGPVWKEVKELYHSLNMIIEDLVAKYDTAKQRQDPKNFSDKEQKEESTFLEEIKDFIASKVSQILKLNDTSVIKNRIDSLPVEGLLYVSEVLNKTLYSEYRLSDNALKLTLCIVKTLAGDFVHDDRKVRETIELIRREEIKKIQEALEKEKENISRLEEEIEKFRDAKEKLSNEYKTWYETSLKELEDYKKEKINEYKRKMEELQLTVQEEIRQKEEEFAKKTNEFREKIAELDCKLKNLELKKERIEYFEKVLRKNCILQSQ